MPIDGNPPRPPALAVTNIVLPPEPELWLKEWLAGMPIPILDSQDAKERFFIRALRLNQPVKFNTSLRHRALGIFSSCLWFRAVL